MGRWKRHVTNIWKARENGNIGETIKLFSNDKSMYIGNQKSP